jgi:hypothetical protein
MFQNYLFRAWWAMDAIRDERILSGIDYLVFDFGRGENHHPRLGHKSLVADGKFGSTFCDYPELFAIMVMQIALHTWWKGYHNDSERLDSMSLGGHHNLQITIVWASWFKALDFPGLCCKSHLLSRSKFSATWVGHKNLVIKILCNLVEELPLVEP